MCVLRFCGVLAWAGGWVGTWDSRLVWCFVRGVGGWKYVIGRVLRCCCGVVLAGGWVGTWGCGLI